MVDSYLKSAHCLVSFADMDVGKGREQDAVSFADMDVGKEREQDAVSFGLPELIHDVR